MGRKNQTKPCEQQNNNETYNSNDSTAIERTAASATWALNYVCMLHWPNVRQRIRGLFNNASDRSAIECFLSESKRSPRCLQALASQVDRCIALKSKMVTKTMGFREGLSMQYFQIWLSE